MAGRASAGFCPDLSVLSSFLLLVSVRNLPIKFGSAIANKGVRESSITPRLSAVAAETCPVIAFTAS